MAVQWRPTRWTFAIPTTSVLSKTYCCGTLTVSEMGHRSYCGRPRKNRPWTKTASNRLFGRPSNGSKLQLPIHWHDAMGERHSAFGLDAMAHIYSLLHCNGRPRIALETSELFQSGKWTVRSTPFIGRPLPRRDRFHTKPVGTATRVSYLRTVFLLGMANMDIGQRHSHILTHVQVG